MLFLLNLSEFFFAYFFFTSFTFQFEGKMHDNRRSQCCGSIHFKMDPDPLSDSWNNGSESRTNRKNYKYIFLFMCIKQDKSKSFFFKYKIFLYFDRFLSEFTTILFYQDPYHEADPDPQHCIAICRQ